MQEQKKILRKAAAAKRKAISLQNRKIYNKMILDNILSLPEYKTCNTLLTYVSFDNEADTHELIIHSLNHRKNVAVPKVLKDGRMEFYIIKSMNELSVGKFGIPEPQPEDNRSISTLLCKTDYLFDHNILMCIPGLAFDRGLNRLGYGGGYYDRYIFYLEEKVSVIKVGVLFDCQLYKFVPAVDYDRSLDILVTATEIIRKE